MSEFWKLRPGYAANTQRRIVAGLSGHRVCLLILLATIIASWTCGLSAEPLRAITVIEPGGQVRVIDTGNFRERWRFTPPFEPMNVPIYGPNKGHLYLYGRDGQVAQFDLRRQTTIAIHRIGRSTDHLALSLNGKWLLAGGGNHLTALRADKLSYLKTISLDDGAGRQVQIDSIQDAPLRQSYIVGLKGDNEIWELSYDPDAEPVYGNFVHSYRKGQIEAVVVEPQPFARRRLHLAEQLHGFLLGPYEADIIAQVRPHGGGAVYSLDARRRVAKLALGATANFAGGVSWHRQGQWHMAVPDRQQPVLHIVNMEDWRKLGMVPLTSPATTVVSHPDLPVIWMAMAGDANTGRILTLDKDSLDLVRSFAATPGFFGLSHDGRYAIAAMPNYLVIYDAVAQSEVKRLQIRAVSAR